MDVTYEEFVSIHGARLRAGLVSTFGPEVGAEATAEAITYGFEHWDRLSRMKNPTGYLYRVGQSEARRQNRVVGYLPATPDPGLPEFEPGLAPALEGLTDSQRVAVLMVHALGWPQVEAAELLEIDVSTLRTHIARGMAKLRTALEATADVR